ncbi:MAG: translation elongation factor Ts [Clostridiales bacterium]|nr:translation elongation factor Ts [Clostridiales bacterium]MDD6872622.1 translation elongation factor Ts [Clostridiales bacterium]MDD7368313.1 translation elongation factor Ts [Clostridiales bacterium]MDY2872198.1 translation elongation factor Ts [Eubacteriales bacterium]
MEITASMVKELREATNAGMMDCKKALKACDGDMDKAVDYLREKGLASAAKKANRLASEGLVGSYYCEKCNTAALVEVNCETDFVAKTDEFKNLVAEIAKQIVKTNPADVDALLASEYEGSTIADMITAKVATIGEKITVRRFVRYQAEHGMVDTYIHMGGKVGVIVELKCDEVSDAVKEVAHDVALQIAAASPVAPEYVRRSEVDPSHLEHEKEILIAQARNEGKPEKIIEKMVEGRIVKFYKEVCLLEQPFVKDGDISVQKMIDAKAKGADVVRFTRYKMGEGLEKKVNDLAAEVAAQTAGMAK